MASAWRHRLPDEAVLARHGGDELALRLPRTSGPDGLEMTRQLTAAAQVGVSAGVAQHEPGETAAQLMRRADAALYEAKAAGRARCALSVEEDATLAGQLRAAVDLGLLEVQYQPLVVMETRQVFGVEALVRWTHPERASVAPSEFVPLAGQHGLITKLGQHVLATALRDLTRLRIQTGIQLSLGMNTSVRELVDPGYASRVTSLMRVNGWPAEHLVIEVTESCLEIDGSGVVTTSTQLLDMGCSTAVDDFGTGYSSLSRLDTLPVEHLRFDSSLVSTLTPSPRRAHVVSSLVTLAHGLELGLVAEGVETPEQAALLQQLGCRFAQGWLYAPAMTIDDLTRYVVQPGRVPPNQMTSRKPSEPADPARTAALDVVIPNPSYQLCPMTEVPETH